MKKKLRSRGGETLLETLLSIMVIALALAMLTTAVVAATRINAKLQEVNQDFSYQADSSTSGTVLIGSGSKEAVISENNGYYYYGE